MWSGEGNETVAWRPHRRWFPAVRFIFYPHFFPIATGSIPVGMWWLRATCAGKRKPATRAGPLGIGRAVAPPSKAPARRLAPCCPFDDQAAPEKKGQASKRGGGARPQWPAWLMRQPQQQPGLSHPRRPCRLWPILAGKRDSSSGRGAGGLHPADRSNPAASEVQTGLDLHAVHFEALALNGLDSLGVVQVAVFQCALVAGREIPGG